MKRRVQSTIHLLIAFFSFRLTLASRFHKVIDSHRSAYDKHFHNAMLEQLAVHNQTTVSTSPSAETGPSLPDLMFTTADLPTSNTNSTYAVGSTSTFQIYTSNILPTSPAPPAACASALTAIVNCNSTVPLMSSYPYLLFNDLASVCTTECASSLATYRANVVSTCGSFGISGSDNVSYLTTLPLDVIAGPYTVQCLQDPTTKQFCAPLLASYNTSGGLLALPNAELCTYCTLMTLNSTVSNPATYSIPVAQLLSTAVTQCGTQFYSYNVTTAPTSAGPPISSAPLFGVNATTDSTEDCDITGRNVTVPTNSTCSAIANQYNVSTNSILTANPSLVGSADCTITSVTRLCIPQACTTYTIQTNDTCVNVADAAGSITGKNITSTQLQSFNPSLGTYCQLMALKVGQTICLTPNGGWPNVGVSVDQNPSATPTIAAPVPTPTVSGTTSNCGRYYQIQAGDICNTVILNNSISLPDFFTLNPEIDVNCTNLWLGYYYCVAPYPPLTSTSISPVITSNYTSASVYSYPIPTASYVPVMATITLEAAGIPAPTNVANGTRTVACGFYYNVVGGDTVDSISNTTGMTAEALYTWNPELQSTSPTPGTAICVVFPRNNYTLATAPTPSNVAPNTTTSDCAEFYTVKAGDSCPSIGANFFISNAEILALNPGLNAQCTNLIVGLAYCVLSVFPPSSNTTTSGPPSNLADGTVTTGCTQYYTIVSGDSCGAIEAKFNITDALFHSMNPEVTSGCTNILIGEAYCVQTNNATTSTGPPPAGPPSNVAAGTITQGCTEYYTVISGDSCSAIETKFNVTDALFHSMNPEVTSGCTNILIGEAYCVQTNNATTSTGPPPNVAAGTITTGCTEYYTVISGDSCGAIETKFNVTDALFHSMNPEINSGCTNIFVGEAYCVGNM